MFGRVRKPSRWNAGHKNELSEYGDSKIDDAFWQTQIQYQDKLIKSKTYPSDFEYALFTAGTINEEFHTNVASDYSSQEEVQEAAIIHPLFNDNKPFFKKRLKLDPTNIINIKRNATEFTGLPSVSKILKETMAPERKMALQLWEDRMVKELGAEGFARYHKAILSRGHKLHSAIEAYFNSGELPEEADNEISSNLLKSASSVLPEITNPIVLESHVRHDELGYHGYLDCVALHKNNLVLIDWKTSGKKKLTLKDTYDDPIQVAAYAGALNHDPRYPVQVKRGAIVVVHNDGTAGKVLPITEAKLKLYWEEWLKRLRLYGKMRVFRGDE